MNFRLVDSQWDKEIAAAVSTKSSEIRIISPFIKRRAAERLLKDGRAESLKVITRFNLAHFADCVSDLSALKLLLEHGAEIRGIKHLHAKVYLFGSTRAIVTSANLTEAALMRNHEFGFVSGDPNIVAECGTYFDSLWRRAGRNLIAEKIGEWEKKVSKALLRGAFVGITRELGDEGVSVGFTPDEVRLPVWVADAEQAFVKFFGRSNDRADRSLPVLDEVRRSGCHWACTYPKRPRSVDDGAVMFMGRLVDNKPDIMIYGRALALRHKPRRDEASAADLQVREWKEDFPYYVRVHHAEFMGGTLQNAIPLSELMETFGSGAFAPTQRNAEKNEGGNTNPKRAYLRQPSVELTPQAATWLNERLEQSYVVYGKLSPALLAQLDWPEGITPITADLSPVMTVS